MCGIFGIHGHPRAVEITQLGIYPVRHRGKGSIGQATRNNEERLINIAKSMDYSSKVFEQGKYKKQNGKTSIAHVRWPTAGPKSTLNAQPHYTKALQGKVVVSCNGDITNMKELKDLVEKENIRVYSDNDAEMMTAVIYIFLKRKMDVFYAISEMKKVVRGAYSAVLMTEWDDALFAFRDDLGIRPMILGVFENRYVVASETCQLKAVGANYFREVHPGEIIRIDDNGLSSHSSPVMVIPESPLQIHHQKTAFCSIEDVYFARPDSIIYQSSGKEVSYSAIRFALGKKLAEEHPVDADMVIPVPRSGIPAAEGYAEALGLPCRHVIITEGVDIGRTFIETEMNTRAYLANLKYTVIADRVVGKRVVVVDDSKIRGLTIQVIVAKLYAAGAKEVHIRIPAPRYMFCCYYGVDTKRLYELIASDKTLDEQRIAVGSPDSLQFLSIPFFKDVLIEFHPDGSCTACFDGVYPIPIFNCGGSPC